MAYYEKQDPATGKDIVIFKAKTFSAHTAAKIPGFSGMVKLYSDSFIYLHVNRGIVVNSWDARTGTPLAIYELCRRGGLDRVYRIKLSTLVRSSRYIFGERTPL